MLIVSKKVLISLLWGLGLVSDVKINVSVSGKMWEGLGLKNKRLGLAPQGLVYITAEICHGCYLCIANENYNFLNSKHTL